jgi:putative FmdB family regulatory protein
MPTYDYKCHACGARREVFLRLADLDKIVKCTKCPHAMSREVSAPAVLGDYPGYHCPITDTWIEGRRAHQENLARHGCRVYEPGETEAFKRQRAAADAAFDRSIDATTEEFIAKLPTEKRDRFASEVEGGLTANIIRSTAE